MNVAEARTLFNAGILKNAILDRADGGTGWVISFETSPPVENALILETQKGSIRIFKSSDTAYDTLVSIGFKSVTTILSD